MVRLSLPSMPTLPSMPSMSMPSMPSLHMSMPNMSMPSMPNMSMPSLPSLPSLPSRDRAASPPPSPTSPRRLSRRFSLRRSYAPLKDDPVPAYRAYAESRNPFDDPDEKLDMPAYDPFARYDRASFERYEAIREIAEVRAERRADENAARRLADEVRMSPHYSFSDTPLRVRRMTRVWWAKQ